MSGFSGEKVSDLPYSSQTVEQILWEPQYQVHLFFLA